MKIENLFIAVDQSIYDDDEVSPVDYALTNAYCLEHYYKRVHQEHLSMFVGFSFKICVLISYEKLSVGLHHCVQVGICRS
jgi:hypothetical protein